MENLILVFILIGLSLSTLYLLSRSTFRKFRKELFYISLFILLIGVVFICFIPLEITLGHFLFIPFYSFIVINIIENLYSNLYKKGLSDTSKKNFIDNTDSKYNSYWNIILGLMTIVLPITVCIFITVWTK